MHWTQQETVLLPDEFGEVWSGSAVVDESNTTGFQTGDDKPIVLIYTAAGKPFTQRIAYSIDGGKTFTKYDKTSARACSRQQSRSESDLARADETLGHRACISMALTSRYSPRRTSNTGRNFRTFTVPGTDECPDFFEMPIESEAAKSSWVWMAANGRYLVGAIRRDGIQTRARL